MTLALGIAGLVAWWASGTGSFVYWWTTDHDLTLGNLFGGALIGLLLGPGAWIAGRRIHGTPRPPRVLMRRR